MNGGSFQSCWRLADGQLGRSTGAHSGGVDLGSSNVDVRINRDHSCQAGGRVRTVAK